ncbi:MAG TPA: ATP-binding cassette domain-containing protein [Thermoanaerobaculaceae bacterium]|nr:ATP-binding cassette domain-containing protein [Thermoanaerobaculaceae bacterium]HRS15844.1 ATP-binding cassette domain-containing protein [Thermoanaerobaculaceae bacterium]
MGTEPSNTGHITVRLEGIHKRYPLFRRRRDRLLALVGHTAPLATKAALRDVSLEARAGEAMGIIGDNGSGKSTLLRIVAGISEPSEGSARVEPPVSAILELGLGFHPEFTGRENATLYGSLIGVPASAMAGRLDEILAFAELGEFIDQPVRTYSSGMSARLAFAVATHVDPRVLVVDEALAVGDGAFQKKCVDRMVRFKEEGRTVLFCSHAMYLVAGFCERAIWLRDGEVAAAGPSPEVIQAYEEHLRHKGKRNLAQATDETAAPLARIAGVSLQPETDIVPGRPLALEIRVSRRVSGLPVHLGVAFEDRQGTCLFSAVTMWDGVAPLVARGEQVARLRIERWPFRRGRLDLTVVAADEGMLTIYDQVVVRGAVELTAGRWEPGVVDVPHVWECE